MSRTFPRLNRSVFSRQPAPGNEPPQGGHDFLRFHPLQPVGHMQGPGSYKPGGATPVNPLTHNRVGPLQPQRQNPLQQVSARQTAPMGHRPTGGSLPFQPGLGQPMGAAGGKVPQNHGAPQPMPPTPQNAAEQFRRINRGLPDGVMYEPLDEETMRILKASQPLVQPVLPAQPPAAQAEAPKPPLLSKDIAKTIEGFAQDEHNAHTFYTNLSVKAPGEAIKDSLAALAGECALRREKYTEMLKEHFASDFAPAEKDIHKNLPFEKAILLAVAEESKTLTTLTNLLEQVEETTLERPLKRIVYRKILGNQQLLYYAVACGAK